MRRGCPILLRCIALTLLAISGGCLYIPTGEYDYTGLDMRKAFGSPTSDRLLCIGLATRADVARVVEAEPHFSGGSAPADAPVWIVRDANCRGFLLVFAPPPAGPHRTRDYFAKLEFDKGDVLRAFEVRREREWRDAGVGMTVSGRKWLEPAEWSQIEVRTEPVARGEPPNNPPSQRTAPTSSGAEE